MVESLEKKLLILESCIKNINRIIGACIQLKNSGDNNLYEKLNNGILENLNLVNTRFDKLDLEIKIKFKEFTFLFNNFINKITIELNEFKTNNNRVLFENLEDNFKTSRKLSKMFSNIRTNL